MTCSRTASARGSTGRSRSSPSCRGRGTPAISTGCRGRRDDAGRRRGGAAAAQPRRHHRRVTVYPRSSPQSSETTRLVQHLRGDVLPPLAEARAAASTSAGDRDLIDFSSVLSSKLWLFIGVVVALSALLLAVVFRSLVDPVAGGRDEPALDRGGARHHRRPSSSSAGSRACRRARSRRSCRC